MGRIKSALEIALERTESVKSDKKTIEQYEARQTGKKLANAFLAGEQIALEAEIRKADRDTRPFFRQGMFDALIAQVALPAAEDDQKRIEAAGKGLEAVIGDGRFKTLYKQFLQYLTRYVSEIQRLAEALRSQYEPQLRKKEEELSRRTGQQVNLDPFQDPEFAALYSRNMNTLRSNYQTMVDQVREQAEQFFRQAEG
jgi:hypothetical protein